MGCGAAKSRFQELPATRLGDDDFSLMAERVSSGQILGLVHLIGWAKASECLIQSPFGGGQGMLAHLTAHRTESGAFSTTSAVIFSAKAATSFHIVRGNAVVAVEVSKTSRWTFGKLTLRLVHTENNIDRTGPGNTMKGGGKPGQRSETVERPDGNEWWNKFNKGKDPPNRIQSTGNMIARSRVVNEYWLRDGDPVAAIGTLQKNDDGTLRLVAIDGGWLTNLATCSMALNELDTPSSAGSSANVVLKMVDASCQEGF